MTEGIHEPKRSGAFVWAENTTAADQECGQRRSLVRRDCGACTRPVMLHCSRCTIQVTGCLCTLLERKDRHEVYKMLARQVGQNKARDLFAKLGYPMPYLADPSLRD